MTEPEESLVGGAISGPVRVGDTVRRPRASAAVHRVLRHLERAGFDGAPRLLEVDGYEPPAVGTGRVVCHNDISPGNTIFREGRAVALIDWDLVGMGPPLWDVAHAVWQFVLPDGPASPDPARRLEAFVSAYGLPAPDRDRLLPAIVTRIHASADGIERRASLGEAPFVRLARLGAPDSMRANASWVAQWTP